MITSRILLMVLFSLLLPPSLGIAQERQPGDAPYQRELTPAEKAQVQKMEEDAAKACAVCGGGMMTLVFVFIGFVVLNIALLIWVARDAKSRGMDSSALWMLLVMFTSLIGLIIYIFSRPQGQLVVCPRCKGKRLAASAICPHCHNP